MLTLGAVAAHGQTLAPSMSNARRNVDAFEKKLASLKDVQEKAQLARGFFGGLKDSESKIEAIGALDSRYVYVVPSGVEGELLAPLLKDSDARVRAEAAQALGYCAWTGRTKIGGNAKQLIALLKDPDARVRSSVLYAMGHSGEDQFFALLKASLFDPDPNVRRDARSEFGVWLGYQQDQLHELLETANKRER
ncbi:MAG TPA: HEAT repeat domain-containing protein [Pirellulales bacterium]|nr:HEAT repeat domain-containing protein [Pirellulales bacterium]